jgi:putative transposase
VILDIYSRYVVGWLIAHRESAELAEQLIADTVEKENIAPGTLTLHADRGTSMRSKGVAALLIDLEVAKTHSRPHVSDDNPYSEAQFKTLKYRPDFPQRFGSIEDARAHCRRFFQWYNHEHRHGGIGLMAPATVHDGTAAAMTKKRAITFRSRPPAAWKTTLRRGRYLAGAALEPFDQPTTGGARWRRSWIDGRHRHDQASRR